MKKIYITAELEILSFEAADVIVTSGDETQGWSGSTGGTTGTNADETPYMKLYIE